MAKLTKVAKSYAVIDKMLDEGKTRQQILARLQTKRIGCTKYLAATYYWNYFNLG